jgi:4-carboxymuconolactone decarboxylase
MHTEGALNQGWSRDEIVESIVTLAPYIGFPKTNYALRSAKKVFDKREKSA